MHVRNLMARLPTISSSQLSAGHERFFGPKVVSICRAAADLRLEGDWVEFGVARGDTARLMHDLLPLTSSLHLFDSFDGLPVDWIGPFKAGHFAIADDQIPSFDDSRVKVVKGLFQETVRGYFDDTKPLAFVHIDCDLYESTWDCLSGIRGSLRPGSIILFDEYFLEHGEESADDEHRAFQEWSLATGVRCEYLWKTEWTQVAVRVLAT